MKIHLIAALAQNNVIGNSQNNTMPWDKNYPEDLSRFFNITTLPFSSPISSKKNVLLMGWNTWQSIGAKPLKGRFMAIMTTRDEEETTKNKFRDEVHYFSSIEKALEFVERKTEIFGDLFVAGGGQIYEMFLKTCLVERIDKIYLTRIHREFIGDVYFPSIPGEQFFLCSGERSIKTPELEFLIYQHRPIGTPEYNYDYDRHTHGEAGYLNLVRQILQKGEICEDRTGTGILSLFGTQQRYDLSEGFPILTTKKMFLRGILEELLWFLRGETDNRILQKAGVHIWDGNTSRDFLDKCGFQTREEGDAGPIYGFQFRHYGAVYKDAKTDYSGQGLDQVKEALRMIREEPNSRRIIINLWDPLKIGEMVLPPCHMVYQFRVYGKKLSCMLYQRSGDVGLGVPFNIASASLLTHIFARLSQLEVGDLVHTIADAHIYRNHIPGLQEQMTRKPFAFPLLKITDRGQKNPEDFQVGDFELIGYESWPKITMKMAV